jgi:hypothetical protein
MSGRVAVRGLMAIAAREVSERVALLGLAVLLAILPFVAPRVGIGDRPLLGGFLGTVMVFTAAILTGSSVIARDLAEGRLGFFLSRPVPWWSIWGGKMLAAFVLTFVAGAIVLGPSAIVGDWSLPAGGWWVQILVPGLIAVIGFANVMAVGYRARSLWFAADLALMAGLAWLAARTYRGLMDMAVDASHIDYASMALWTLAFAVTLAGAAQVAQGRAHIARSHRVMAITLWAVLTPAVLAYAAWGTWVDRVAPSHVRSVLSAWSAPKGSWIVVAGRARWPRPESLSAALLVDTSSGRFLRLGPAFSPLRPGFSADATRAAWVSDPFGRTPHLAVADLGARVPALSELPLPIPPGPVLGFALSFDGRYAAVVQPALATVFALGSAQAAATTPMRRGGSSAIAFDDAGRAHLLNPREDPLSPGRLDLVVVDPGARSATTTGQIDTRGNPREAWGPAAARVAVVHRPDLRPSLTLHDGTTGALLGTLVPEGRAGRIWATFLLDGRLAVVESGRGVILRVFSTEGAESWSLDVAPAFSFARATEVAPGVVAIELPFGRFRGRSDTVLVDVTARRVIRRESGLRPAASSWFASRAQTVPDASSLFIDDRDALVRLDIATGARQVLLGGS